MNEIKITTRDRLMRAWENSKESVRDYQNYSHSIQDDLDLANMFAEFAEDEGVHAAKLLQALHRYQSN